MTTSQRSFGLLLVFLLAITYGIYSQGFSANFKLDDAPNLSLLAYVNDKDSLFHFILSGSAGPSGRPLALLSFVINQPAWPVDAEPFLYTNTLIHLINGLLVAWLTYRLAQTKIDEISARRAALIGASIWMLHPMFVSTNLYVIQRMTSLSATFMLLGLVGYVASRQNSYTKPGLASAGILLSLGFGSILAVLCKENAAILPLLAWIIDRCFLDKVTDSGWTKRIRILATIVATTIVGLYILTKLPILPQQYGARNFSFSERLMTETRVLFDYLKLLIIPVRSEFGIFHDNYPISRGLLSPASTLFSIASLITLVVAAVKFRHKFPLFFFATAWFLAAHTIESSIFPLEIYFEHRNYVPAIGIAIAFGIASTRISIKYVRTAIIAGCTYIALLIFVLFETVMQWGEPDVTADLWYRENPGSQRALQYYAQSLLARDQLDELESLFNQAVKEHPENPAYQVQNLITHCLMQRPLSTAEWAHLYETLGNGRRDYSVHPSIEKLTDLALDKKCPSVLTVQAVASSIHRLVVNPNYISDGVVAHSLYISLAQIYDSQKKFKETLSALKAARKHRDYPETTLMIASVLAVHGFPSEAIKELNARLDSLSATNPKDQIWQKELKGLRDNIQQSLPQASSLHE